MTYKILAIALAGLIIPAQTWAAGPFEGPYGGVSAGVGILKQEGAIFAGPFEEKTTSVLVGGLLGIRTGLGDNGQFVIGLEADVNYYTSGSDWRYGIYGTAGIKVGDKSLLYVRGGYGKLTGREDGLDGLVFGGGYEFAFSESMNLRLDYKNLHYGEINFSDNMVRSRGHEISTAVIFHF